MKNWWEDEKRFGTFENCDDKFVTTIGDGIFFKTRAELEEWEKANLSKTPNEKTRLTVGS